MNVRCLFAGNSIQFGAAIFRCVLEILRNNQAMIFLKKKHSPFYHFESSCWLQYSTDTAPCFRAYENHWADELMCGDTATASSSNLGIFNRITLEKVVRKIYLVFWHLIGQACLEREKNTFNQRRKISGKYSVLKFHFLSGIFSHFFPLFLDFRLRGHVIALNLINLWCATSKFSFQ